MSQSNSNFQKLLNNMEKLTLQHKSVASKKKGKKSHRKSSRKSIRNTKVSSPNNLANIFERFHPYGHPSSTKKSTRKAKMNVGPMPSIHQMSRRSNRGAVLLPGLQNVGRGRRGVSMRVNNQPIVFPNFNQHSAALFAAANPYANHGATQYRKKSHRKRHSSHRK